MANTVLVCGGRDYWDETTVFSTLDAQYLLDPFEVLVTGACWSGADHLAKTWAKYELGATVGVRYREHPAEWRVYGKAAGPKRNGLMLAIECPRLVIAFPGGSGTADMIRQARAAGVEVWMISGET